MITMIAVLVFLFGLSIMASWLDQHGAPERAIAARERRADFLTRGHN